MRKRERSKQLLFPNSTGRWMSHGSGQSDSFSISNIAEDSEEMVDQVNPGFFPAEKLGKLKPVSPMSKVDVTTMILPGSGNFTSQYNPWPGEPTGWQPYIDWSGDGLFARFDIGKFVKPPKPEVNKGALLQRALSSAQTNAFDKLTFAAEFQKTVAAFATAHSRFSDHIKKVWAEGQRNANAHKNRHTRLIDFITDAWFEWRFSLRPVLYDIEAFNELYRRLLEGAPVLSRGWASDSDSTVGRSGERFGACRLAGFYGDQGTEETQLLTPGDVVSQVARVWTTTLEARASVGVEVTTRDLTMADPVLTMWELTPMSVFLDYFITVGDMLAACSPFATGKLAFATYSTKLVHELTETAQWFVPPDSSRYRYSGSCTPSTIVQKRVEYFRSLEQVSPTLSIDVQLDVGRVLDLIALTWALRRRLAVLSRIIVRR